MKIVQCLALASLVSLLLAGPSAQANLFQANDPTYGPNSLTVDTATGLAWLDLTATTGLSYDQVLADTQAGGIFSGFRFATAQEVLDLFAAAGVPGAGYYALSNPTIQSLIPILGPSGMFNGYAGLLGLSATASATGAQDAPAIYATGVNGTEMYWVNGGGVGYGGGTAYGRSFSDPALGSWLVTNVPETSDATVYLLAVASLLGFQYWHRKPKAV